MSSIVIDEQARIPAWVVDHPSFRRWIYSGEFPERGRFGYFDEQLWVDTARETLNQNQIKLALCTNLGKMIRANKLGTYYPAGMMLTNLEVPLSTEPGGMFFSYGSKRSGAFRLEKGGDSLEVIGTPEMVLEVVSKSTVRKDTVSLLDLYYRAGIAEYWLIDSRPDHFRFDIYKSGRRKYVATRKTDGWIKSEVFGKSFKLTRTPDGEDGFEYVLATR